MFENTQAYSARDRHIARSLNRASQTRLDGGGWAASVALLKSLVGETQLNFEQGAFVEAFVEACIAFAQAQDDAWTRWVLGNLASDPG